MNFVCSLALAFIISISSFAQKTVLPRKYFDLYWKPLKSEVGASYYRVAVEKEGQYTVHDYYISGKVQMAATCSKVEPKLTTIGNGILYYESGAIQQEGQFVDEQPVGLHIYYYENGKIQKEIIHVNDQRKYKSYFDENGVNLITSGRGIIKQETKGFLSYLEIEDSLLVTNYSTTQNSSDTIYSLCEKMPEYKGGPGKLRNDLSANFTYPRSARKQGIQGVVYIDFNVSKEGRVKDAKILKGLSPDCDKVALNAVSNLGQWSPAMHKGKPVEARFIQPMTFQLQ